MSSSVAMVTGGSGFVGSHLVERLLADGYQVHVFDRLPLEDANNLAHVRGHPALHYSAGDLRNADELADFFRPDAEVIYHLASVVGVKHYLADPLSLIDVVVGGTRSILDLARKSGTKIVFTSTSEVYGKNPNIPWREDGDRVLGPTSVDRWSYSSCKAVCEHMLYALHRQFDLPFTIVRFFNVYGPRQNPCYVVSQSIYRTIRGEQPLCYDNGHQTRCFTFVEDIIDGLVKAATSHKALGEIFNLGNPTETTIREVLELIIEVTGSKQGWASFDTKHEFGARYEDIERRVPCVAKAEELLGWTANTSLADGIARTVAWASENEWWLADGRA